MTENNRFDVLIMGAGQAGIPLAHDLAKAGKRVALVEEKYLGGSCVNFGCMPTKAVIASAHVAHLARRGIEFGVRLPTVEICLAADGAIAWFSSNFFQLSVNADRAPQLKAGVMRDL